MAVALVLSMLGLWLDARKRCAIIATAIAWVTAFVFLVVL
jgi:hypothetical protein